jgi:hypothetical protein
MRKPRVFVSSTCYDLRQVRSDIKEFFEELGLEPMLSEHDSFPVDPDLGPVDNCLNAVTDNADIFVLIVGERFGSMPRDGKSVTNLEYLTARAKGIPSYVFVSAPTLNIIPVWKANRGGDFANVVDSPKLFEFVAEIKEGGANWVFPFDAVQDICRTLRVQLAYLFMDALELRTRIAASEGASQKFEQLHGTVLRLAIERPPLWEYLLFNAGLQQELSALADLKRDWLFGIAVGPSHRVSIHEFVSRSIRVKLDEATRFADTVMRLIHEALPAALGPDGVSGSVDSILHVANRLAVIYRAALEWKLDFRRVEVHPEASKLRSVVSTGCDGMVADIERFSAELDTALKQAVQNLRSGTPASVRVNLKLSGWEQIAEFQLELDRITSLFGSGRLSNAD